MSLRILSPSSIAQKHSHYYHDHLLPCNTPLLLSISKPNLTVRAQNPSSDPAPPPPPKKSTPPAGLGFGTSSSSSSTASSNVTSSVGNKKKQKGKRERASIIRRTPVEKPALISQEDEAKTREQTKNESAFLLAWLGLGGLILVEGIALAASGFLPEEWDRFFVKFLYPSFTPTVFLFVAGTVGYGVLKYLQNEKPKDKK